MVKSITSSAEALRADPSATLKPYVPEFVIHAGEKTYEICRDTAEKSIKNVESTSGFIVTKVNGVITSVSNVPVIHNLVCVSLCF